MIFFVVTVIEKKNIVSTEKRKGIQTMFSKLWNDDSGAIIATEYLILSSIVVFGVVGGLTTVRDAINGELFELSNSIRAIHPPYNNPASTTNRDVNRTQGRCGFDPTMNP